MRPFWKDLFTALLLGIILPGLLIGRTLHSLPPRETAEETTEAACEPPAPLICMVRFAGGEIRQMDMDAYLTGVVLAEMPASFAPDALKAQAVAARTYTCKAMVTGGHHGDGSVCTDPGCCQGYYDPANWPDGEGVQAVQEAVRTTSGWVLCYGDTLIEATYFSASAGMTEDAVAVWGTDYPYLRSVPSPGEAPVRDSETLVFTPEAFQEALGRTLPGSAENWFSMITHTRGGGVAAVTISGQTYTGTQIRQLLSLRSTVFQISAAPNAITVTTRGYGHRVGLSQYGAQAMAESGSSWQEILRHYYTGADLVYAPDLSQWEED